MNIFEMTKEDFDKVPERGGWSRDIGEFRSLVIIPQDYAHDSGWMCMDFVAVDKEGEPICKLSGCSDVLDLDGIGGGLITGLVATNGRFPVQNVDT